MTAPTAPGAGADLVPRSQRLLAEVRRGQLFRGTVAAEAELGWPIPLVRKTGTGTGAGSGTAVFLTVPAFRTRPRPEGGLDLLPPFAHLTLAWPTGQVVALLDHRFEHPWPGPVDLTSPVGTFPHPGLPREAGTYRQFRSTAFAYYDELCAALAERRALPPAWWRRFADVLAPLLEPGLVPFYRVLGPKFIARILPELTDGES